MHDRPLLNPTETEPDYATFLARKAITAPPVGLASVPALNEMLFPFQRDIVSWALRRGRAAIFADCGLGKTPIQLEWADKIPGRVLILAPLAVAGQTVDEAAKFGVDGVAYARSQEKANSRIVVTNYEMLQHFDAGQFSGVVLDESSILKSYDGPTRTRIIETFRHTPYRLACTATPAPNDHMELGNHAEFLGTMTRPEMLSMFFVHDGGETQSWRLKGHAESEFWKWVCSWAVMLRKPSDLGYDDDGFVLPPIKIERLSVGVEPENLSTLFPMPASSLQERIAARRDSVEERARLCADIIKSKRGPFLVWCNLNRESEAIARMVDGAVEVRGSDSPDAKENALRAFSAGKIRVLVTKPSIAGFGMNWQHCAQMAFVGLSDSYEQYYQAVRRCWRFGQKKPVKVYIVTADTEGAVVANIERKEREAQKMADGMVEHMRGENIAAIHGQTERTGIAYKRERSEGRGWTLDLGDCVEAVSEMPSDSVPFTIYSPPFASLYTYSNSDRDMGNAKDHDQFFDHYKFLVRELYRATMPGRLLSFHCMNLPTSKARDGVIGITDFRGDLIRIHEAEGFIYHSEVVIWKDPVTAMQRTKALGLLYKQLRKDSAMSRQGIPDYLVTMRKPGTNPRPVTKTHDSFPVDLWQNYASPVWMDINPSDTLQKESAREHKDERHIAPLQLEVIRRAVRLWTNPGDVVLSPFAGIGSEGVVSLQLGRGFHGVELKRSYYQQAARNLRAAESAGGGGLFDSTPTKDTDTSPETPSPAPSD